MRLPVRAVLPFARYYCALSESGETGRELKEALERRVSRLPAGALALAALGALAVRWLAPLLLLARPCRFESLSPAEADMLLVRLQRLRGPLARGLFLSVKWLVLPACYSSRSRLRRLGYGPL